MRVASLFSGIGGFEVGLQSVGAVPVLFCESDEAAQAVLKGKFPNVTMSDDVRTLNELPESDLLVAGWPCQDLSQAGQTSGLKGSRSSLIEDVFRIVDNSRSAPEFVILENVAFALSLNSGEALNFATSKLEKLGYNWAFRILDSNFFGLPQRRRRLFILGSRSVLPEQILFDGMNSFTKADPAKKYAGFYWTEGNRGLGWSEEAVPPLKGGSNLSIPSPPAIWDITKGTFATPTIQSAERLQGFEPDWTLAVGDDSRSAIGKRWRQIGNAVSVNVAKWLGEQLHNPSVFTVEPALASDLKGSNAGWGGPKRDPQYFSKVHEGPSESSRFQMSDFGDLPTQPLSERAAVGFLTRYLGGSLRQNSQFADSLARYCAALTSNKALDLHAA